MNTLRQTNQRSRGGAVQLPLAALLLLLALLVALTSAAQGQANSTVQVKEQVFAGSDLAALLPGTAVSATGVTGSAAAEAVFTSLPIAAPLAFTDLGALWIADLPAGSSHQLEIRTSPDGSGWSQWHMVEADTDLTRPGDPETAGDLVPVPQTVRWHRYAQVRWRVSAGPDGQLPRLQRLRLAFIDAGVTPTTPQPDHQPDTYPKPAVVSRTAWGCPDGQNSPEWPAEYQPVTHLIVHHTVTPNDDTDFAARVRSIWTYHAITRGWGDIGYNYLVDRNGGLYEGRAGGDDVIGGHAAPYNSGTLGLAFMGTFTSASAPPAMLTGAADLLAWKADQKGIDPQGWGWLIDRTVRRIAGHRDVGNTACPGDALYAQLPALRDAVGSRLDALAYVFVDELQAELSNANWYVGPNGCGYQGHAYWTFSTTDPGQSANWGTWRPNLPRAGQYRVYAYVPWCINGYPDSSGVYYHVRHAGGETTVPVSQAATAGGWAELGLFDFAAGTAGSVYLNDLALDSGRTIWFDSIKWHWEGAPAGGPQPPVNLSPADQSWSTSRVVAFRWSPSPTPGVDHYWLLVARDPGLTDMIHSSQIDPVEPEYVYSFWDDHTAVYWGLEAHTSSGYSPPSGPWRLGVDTGAPAVAVSGVFVYPDGHYSVHWGGQDAVSGVATYDVETRLAGQSSWTPWLSHTALHSSSYHPPAGAIVYFRARATDTAGNLGPYDAGTWNTSVATLLDHQALLPVAVSNWPLNP